MSVGKSVSLVLGICFIWICILGCEGDPGKIGPPGFDGPDGPDGGDFAPDPVADQVMSLMIVNGSSADFNGAAKVDVTSSATATPGASTLVATRVTSAPVIDGRASNTNEWIEAPVSTLQLGNLYGADNGITSAQVRLAYNRENVYMQIRWTEVASGSFDDVADTTWKQWTFDGLNWSQSGGDDRLYILWETTPISGWDANGVTSVFNGTTFKTPAAGEQADLWVWSATENYYSGSCGDKSVVFSAGDGLRTDLGLQYVIDNPADGPAPKYMLVNSPTTGSQYPLLSFEYGPYSSSLAWESGATIPGVITLQPSGSAADIKAAATYTNGTWTVELKRARNTGSYDDVAL